MDTPDLESVKKQASSVAGEIAEKARHKASELAADLGPRAQETLKAQWQQIRQQSPELLYASVAEAEQANHDRTEANVAYYRDNPEGLGRRLVELDEEWDVNRVLQVVASAGTVAGFWFSMTKSKLWLLVPLVLAGGALHHGLTGRSPAEDLARRLGFRTRNEIESERRRLQELDSADSNAG
jgi:hypothetical protein